MNKIITSDVLIAYSQCPRKAFLLLCPKHKGSMHEYIKILDHRAQENQQQFINDLKQRSTSISIKPYSIENLKTGADFLTNATLQAEGLEATCGILTKVSGRSSLGSYYYEPTIFVGTHKITAEQKLELFFVGHILGLLQNKTPIKGKIVGADGKSHRVKLESSDKTIVHLLEMLQEWATAPSAEEPATILNKHCSTCQFRDMCREQTEKEGNLSLLDRVTPKIIRKYEKKGIFTVKQLSYLYKPRRRKKRAKNPAPITHKLELQALAIRTGKIYLQDLPDLSRQSVEIFLDIEGIPDQKAFYLIGLLICEDNACTYHSFWADTLQDESNIWRQFLEMVNEYPDAPIYHYGSYEPRALTQLARRYESDGEALKARLVNVNTYIYGRVYFPVHSNRLKEIGEFIGASWTAKDASGLQSLVWRHRWDETHNTEYQQILLTYNEDDCRALMLLMNELTRINNSADTLSDIDFADQSKRQATEASKEVHSQFNAILKFAHADYDKKKISFRQDKKEKVEKKSKKRKLRKKRHRVTKTINLPHRKICPKCNIPLHPAERNPSKRLVIDLVPMRTGMRKTVTQYIGSKGYCENCYRSYVPTEFNGQSRSELYGYGFQVWCVYLRISLKIAYAGIMEIIEEQFNEKMSNGMIPTFMRNVVSHQTETNKNIKHHLLKSPFIHADETTVNIRGTEQYVWVFTDGKHVVFKHTETREAKTAHEFLVDYNGILISDFYPGYDAVDCRQQKCWVHLIRDMNNDLWGAPFDSEYETFVLEVRNLILPIMEVVQKYGLKQRNLDRFRKRVDKFYAKVIVDSHYKSELAIKYQTRFIRYRESLFTFLEQDGIPWQNNTAERAIRHLVVQEKISGTFFASLMSEYLRLLEIKQTCRFQEVSFLRFLMSHEKDVDNFAATKSRRNKSK